MAAVNIRIAWKNRVEVPESDVLEDGTSRKGKKSAVRRYNRPRARCKGDFCKGGLVGVN